MVLLTLLSIVQALALELLWSHVREADYLFGWTWMSAISWLQIGTTFLGLILIWVVYASTAMRFRWVPTTSDSVYPFVIGLMEFVLVEVLGPDSFGLWLIAMAIIFGMMVRVSHKTMRRARQDADNAPFFSQVGPATARDFVIQTAIVIALILAGLYFETTGDRGVLALLAVLATAALLLWQFVEASRFWARSVALESEFPDSDSQDINRNSG